MSLPRLKSYVICLGMWMPWAISLYAPAAAEVSKVTVFTSGTEGYHTYRIPTIVEAANGDLLAIAEGRKNSVNDHGDIDLVMKRSTDGGNTWGALQVIQDEYDNPTANVTIGNPAPVVDMMDPDHPGRIWLPFSRDNDRVFVTYSDDSGTTWADRVEITSTVKDPTWGWYATGPVHGIQLTRGDYAGRLIIPCDHRVGSSAWGSHVVYSDDHGQTWQLGAEDTHADTDPLHPNENVAVELVDGRIYINAREQHGSDPATRAIAYSSDGGLTYGAPFVAEPNITSPVVQNSALRFAAVDSGDAQNILVYSSPGDPVNRQDMTLRFSLDEGKTWTGDTVIDPGPAAYSDLIKLDNEYVGVLYEAGESSAYENIFFTQVAVNELVPAAWNGIVGDVNQDGVFNADDIESFIAAWTPVTSDVYLGGVDSYTNGDLNFNGVNDLNDAFLLRQAMLAAGIPSVASLNALFATPEPRCAALFVSECICLAGIRWTRRKRLS